jgi:hypothetical protein
MKKLIFLALLMTLLSLTATAQYEKKVQAGDTLRATVIPDRGWQLKGWYIGDELISTESNYTSLNEQEREYIINNPL